MAKRIPRNEPYILKVTVRMPGVTGGWVELAYKAGGLEDCRALAKDVNEAYEQDKPLDLHQMRFK